MVKNPPANAGDVRDLGLVPRLGRPSGIGNGNPLQYSCQENSMDRRACWAIVHGVARSWTGLCDWAHTCTIDTSQCHACRKCSWAELSWAELRLSHYIYAYIHTHNGILPSHKEEWNFFTCNNMNELVGHYTKWNKSDRVRQIPFITYMWNLKI